MSGYGKQWPGDTAAGPLLLLIGTCVDRNVRLIDRADRKNAVTER
ncbi:hypothetical protein ABIB25_004560 [Nakamurella sp. UYEF19]